MARAFQRLAGDAIPLDGHITPDVVLMRDGSVMTMFEVRGVYPGASDAIDRNNWSMHWHNALLNIAAEDVELFVYECRGTADGAALEPALCTRDFAFQLDRSYRAHLADGMLYLNRLYIALIIRAPLIRRVGRAGVQAAVDQRLRRLQEVAALLMVQTRAFGLTRLGQKTRRGFVYSEIAEALGFALTGVWREIPLTTGRLGSSLITDWVRFRGGVVEYAGSGQRFGQLLGWRDPPANTIAGMFHGLSHAPYPCTLVHSFRCLSNAQSDTVIGRKQNKQTIAGDKAHSQTAALGDAADELLQRKWVLGDHNVVLLAFAEDHEALISVGNAARRDLAAAGLVAVPMTRVTYAAFLSMIPGNHRWRPRPGVVKSENFVDLAPLYAFPAGDKESKWGPPIATLRTLAGTPYRFHWHVGGVGNTLVTGHPGQGKTLTTGFLAAMTAGRARWIALDHKRGWQFLIRRMGGDYGVLRSGEGVFAPLKALTVAPADIDYLNGLLRACIGGQMTEEEGRRLSIALATVMRLPPALRSVAEICGFFDDTTEGAGRRLEKWVWGHELGWVIDAPQDRIAFGDISGVDVTKLLDHDRARGPALSYLFHRVAMCLDGFPLLLTIDEGWRALKDPAFRLMIEQTVRTIRSKNGIVVFITQDPGDIDADIARILIGMCPTQMHFANPRGQREDYVDRLKLSEGAWEAIHRLPTGEGFFVHVHDREAVALQLPLGGSGEFIPVLSATEADLTEDEAEQERQAA